MAANTAPIYTLVPDMATDAGTTMPQPITTGSNTYDGTNAAARLSHTAGVDGSYARLIIAKALGTNIATVARIFLNNGSTPGTAANNALIGEISLPVTTADADGATPEIKFPLEYAVPPGHRLYIQLGTSVAAGWIFTVVAGQYS